MPNFNIETFKLFKYPMDTVKALIYYSFRWLILLWVLYKSLNEFFLYVYIIWLSLFIIFLSWWLFKRFNYSYWSDKLYVVFAVRIEDYEDKKLYKIYRDLINQFEERLKDYNFSKRIKIKIKPVDIKFSDHSAAEAKTALNMPCSTLIISGLPITSKKEIQFKFNFHYEFIYPGNKSNEEYYKEVFGKKISKVLAGKQWKIKEDNIKSKESLYGNMFSVSTYILSLCLASLGNADEAIKLLEPIRKEIKNKCNENIVNIKPYGPLIADIKNYLFKINRIKFNVSYWNLKADELKPIAVEMQRLDSYSYDTYMALAIVYELENNREEAIEYTQKAENSHPKNVYEFKFNYLYFYLTEKNILRR